MRTSPTSSRAKRKPSRRWTRPNVRLLATTALVTAAVACGGGDDAIGDPTTDRIEVLRVAAPGQATDDLNPLLTNGLADYTAVFHIYDTLVRLVDGRVELALATAIEPNDDATAWTITIRDDATFHDGRPVSATDVAASLALLADPEQSPNYAGFFADIDVDGVTELDEVTTLVPLHRPRGDFVDTMLTFASFVFPSDVADWTEPIGSGPYRLASYSPGGTTVLSAFDDHWEGVPSVERIEISTVADATARLNGVRGGQLDVAIKIDPVGARAADPDDVRVLSGGTPTSQGMSLVMNIGEPPFDELDVRRAVAMTVDRQALVDAVLLGYGSVGNDLIGAGLPGFNSSLAQVERDVAAARTIFEAHGVDELTLVVGDVTPGIVAAGELLIEQFGDVGVTLVLDRRDPTTYYADYAEFVNRPFQGLYWVNRPASAFLGSFTGSASFFNPSGYHGPEYDALLSRAQAEVDPEVREGLFAEAQSMYHEQGGTVVWGLQDQLDATAPDLEGVEIVQSIPLLSKVRRS